MNNRAKYKIVTDRFDNKVLYFDSRRERNCREYILKRGITHLLIDETFYKSNNLDPIIPLAENILSLTFAYEINFEKLNKFKNLVELNLPDSFKNTIEFDWFPILEILCCNLNNKIKKLEKCKNLKILILRNYNPKSKDLTLLPNIEYLEHLGISCTNIVSLKGIEQFTKLAKIELYRAPKLESIEYLKYLSDSLKEIEFENCKKITDYEVLGELNSINRIMLSSSGILKSLTFLESLTNLKFFSFWDTNVLDGNLENCHKIDYVGFDNKRHYNYKFEDFKLKF